MVIGYVERGSRIDCNKYVSINQAEKLSNQKVEELSKASVGLGKYLKDKNVTLNLAPSRDGDCLMLNLHRKPLVVVDCVPMQDTVEKPFLRNLYERVQLMVEGKSPRIEAFKDATIANIKKMGKIK